MNKNKLFLLIGVWILTFAIWAIFLILKTGGSKATVSADLSIWTIWHDTAKFQEFVNEYNEDMWVKAKFSHTNFESYNDYQIALLYELATGTWPDIFMLNNSESLFLEDKIAAIDPSAIQAEEFRKNFLSPFSDELVASVENPEKPWTSVDVLIWVPAGFETLGLFYDRRSFIGQDLDTWSGLAEAIKDLKERNSRTIPLGIGHGSSVFSSADIFTQFLINNESRWVNDLESSTIKNAVANYQQYGDISWINGYNSIVSRLETLWKNNIALFSTGEIKMLIGFPSIIKEIKESGFSKSFLSAEPFPKSTSADDKILVNYNYFVINNDSTRKPQANSFLGYLADSEWAEEYYEHFTDKIPSHALLTDNLDQKFDLDFNISYKDLLRDKVELVSYDKWFINKYDSFVENALDDMKNATDKIITLQAQLNCTLLNLNGTNTNKPNCQK